MPADVSSERRSRARATPARSIATPAPSTECSPDIAESRTQRASLVPIVAERRGLSHDVCLS
jgi:hypothetical protein